MKIKFFSQGNARAFIVVILFLIVASFFFQTVSADDVLEFEQENYNFSFQRGEFFVGPLLHYHNKLDGKIIINDYPDSFGKGGDILIPELQLPPYGTGMVEFTYNSYDSYGYGENPPGTNKYTTNIPYSFTPSDPDEPGLSGYLELNITITILPDDEKDYTYRNLVSPDIFDISLNEGEAAHSTMKLKGQFREKLGLAFSPSEQTNIGNTTFGEGGIFEWEDSPDGYYELNEDQETEITIIYCTSEEKTGIKTPPGKYEFEFRLYFWTITDEGEPDYEWFIRIPYHLTVLPKSASVPEFPLNSVYAAGLVILGLCSLLVLRTVKK